MISSLSGVNLQSFFAQQKLVDVQHHNPKKIEGRLDVERGSKVEAELLSRAVYNIVKSSFLSPFASDKHIGDSKVIRDMRASELATLLVDSVLDHSQASASTFGIYA